MAQSRAGGVSIQKLLFPVTVDVSPAERLAFEDSRENLAALGFSVAPFGDNTLMVDEIPALLPAGDVARLLRELLGEILEWRRAGGGGRLPHPLAAAAARPAPGTAHHPPDPPPV